MASTGQRRDAVLGNVPDTGRLLPPAQHQDQTTPTLPPHSDLSRLILSSYVNETAKLVK